jgi:uncharacterized protein (DUF58 family)
LPDAAGQAQVPEVPIHWGLSAHARRLLTVGLAGLLVAVVTGRPEFAGLAAPALVLLSVMRADRPPTLALRAVLAAPRLVEGAEYSLPVVIGVDGAFTARLVVRPAEGITAGPPTDLPARTADGGELRTVRLRFTPERWGSRRLGLLAVTLTDRYRLTEGRVLISLPLIDCRPAPARMASSIVLSRLPSRLGEHSSRSTGEGAEFFGVREFVPGDRQRRINWPATTRLGTVHLSTFAAERTQNVVIIADTTADVGEPGSSSLDLVLRGAAGAIARYLAARDRVGLIMAGRRLTWMAPGQGQRHGHQLLDLLVSTQGGWERAAGLARLPRAALPPGALILVFSPLLDPRLIESVRDLRERGFTVILVDVLNAEPSHDGSRMSDLTTRLWRLEQQAIRFSLAQIGVPAVHWDGVSALDEPLAPYSRRTLAGHR